MKIKADGKAARKAREAEGLTQQSCAARVACNVRTYRTFEQGEPVQIEILAAAARVLGLDPFELIPNERHPQVKRSHLSEICIGDENNEVWDEWGKLASRFHLQPYKHMFSGGSRLDIKPKVFPDLVEVYGIPIRDPRALYLLRHLVLDETDINWIIDQNKLGVISEAQKMNLVALQKVIQSADFQDIFGSLRGQPQGADLEQLLKEENTKNRCPDCHNEYCDLIDRLESSGIRLFIQWSHLDIGGQYETDDGPQWESYTRTNICVTSTDIEFLRILIMNPSRHPDYDAAMRRRMVYPDDLDFQSIQSVWSFENFLSSMDIGRIPR